MTTLQFIGCLIFNVRHFSFIINNKDDRSLILSRFLYILLMTYTLISFPQFFICFSIAKTIFDIISLIIKFEASGVMTSEHKETLIDDFVNIISFIIYVGG
jgi:hypothetical protein